MRLVPGAALLTSAWEPLAHSTHACWNPARRTGGAIGVYVVVCIVLVIIAG